MGEFLPFCSNCWHLNRHTISIMSPPVIASLSPAAAAAPPLLKSLHSEPPPQLSRPEITSISRRAAAVLLSSVIIPILRPPLASAFSIGISGPKEWLKEQKKKSFKFLLAPVDASRNILQSAYLLLMKSEGELGEGELAEVQNLLVSAARDCVPRDRSSFVELQSNTGVEVCTFRLIVKNAASLLDDNDPLKLEAESKLNDLIRSFSSLSGMAREESVQLTLNRKQRVVDALKDTISSLNNFEQGIKDCLQV
ncbi:uncharacterized protein LOC121792735 isoform X2 [Salvia splendens]|uniref:uncharacterized protein LOC121792735 isoform X2 n=1 Tax=Salvia splendens TaxID=180675 RepID=UPI001C27420A|nr:uncharacterized protein LOC121792735 isoform X2 [Salvia splendens]